MKHTKSMWICLLLCAVLLTLCACGAKPSATEHAPASTGDYKELESMLDKGQYDAAITWIEGLRRNSERVVETIDMDQETRRIMDQIVGDYSLCPSRYFNTDFPTALSIRDDMTFTQGDETHTFEITEIREEPNMDATIVSITYSVLREDGSAGKNGGAIYLYNSGYITMNDAYQKNDFVEALIQEQFTGLEGTYKDPNNADRQIIIREDRTVEIDGAVRPILFQPYWEDHTKLSMEYPTDNNYTSTLSTRYTDNGLLMVDWNCYRMSDLELVQITGDNLFDYFEWGDWELDYVNTNAFDEVSGVYLTRSLKLKDAYAASLFSQESSIALEVSYQRAEYQNVSFTWNPEDNSVAVTLPDRPRNVTEDSAILSYLNSRGHHEEDGYVVDFYYIAQQSLSSNITADTPRNESGAYELEESWFHARYNPEDLVVLRSETVLAFVK